MIIQIFMNETQIWELISYIKNDAILSPIFSTRVVYVSFVNEQSETNLSIRDLTDNRQQVSWEAMIEFKIVSPEKIIGPIQMRTYLRKILDVFEKNNMKIWNTTYYQNDCLGDLFVSTNTKWQYEWITTIIFKQTK